jgi:LysR substrate binding domain-containing protein/predicted GTPase
LIRVTSSIMETKPPVPRAILVGIQVPSVDDVAHTASLDELGRLVKTLGYEVVGTMSQKRDAIDGGTVLGKGRLAELASITGGTGVVGSMAIPQKSKARERFEDADEKKPDAPQMEPDPEAPPKPEFVIVDHEISPSQARNLERATGAEHISLIQGGLLDVAFVGDTVRPGDCDVVPLWKERLFVALPRGHRLRHRTAVGWPALRSERFIIRQANCDPELCERVIKHLSEHTPGAIIEKLNVGRETLMHLVGIGRGLTSRVKPLSPRRIPMSFFFQFQVTTRRFGSALYGRRETATRLCFGS